MKYAVLLFLLGISSILQANRLTLDSEYSLEAHSFFIDSQEVHFYGMSLGSIAKELDLSSQEKRQEALPRILMDNELRRSAYEYLKVGEAQNLKSFNWHGALGHKTGALGNGKYLYVIKDDELYLKIKVQTANLPYKLRFGHSSFFRGEEVEAAGKLHIREGKLAILDNVSGHYKPDIRSIKYTLGWLQNRGYDLSNIQVRLYPDADSYEVVAGRGSECSLEKFLAEKDSMK